MEIRANQNSSGPTSAVLICSFNVTTSLRSFLSKNLLTVERQLLKLTCAVIESLQIHGYNNIRKHRFIALKVGFLNMDNQKIEATIALLRNSKNMTQTELGERVGVSFQAVSKWERGGSQT
ncbi:MAG: helix-turn-helix transcriptional regulator [Ruminococcaceae bacterium]|nr:helix-turn-helix transcriptional regulator [Oscillospiraceae bacterium]